MMAILRFVILSLTFMSCSQKEQMAAISANNKGVILLKAESLTGAQQNFNEALALEPFDPTFHNNLGVSFEAAKDLESALKSYKFAEEKAEKDSAQDMVKFTARFNQGQALAKQSKIDEALAEYQKALEVNPTSKETKHNIELLSNRQKSGGGGDGKDKDDKNNKNKDKDDKNNKNKDKKEDKKDKDKNKDDKNKDKDKDDKDKEKKEDKPYQGNEKYKPRPFKGELSENDVKKILGELKQQEQKIRADYNRKEGKESPRDKDW